jgi:tetratricopeptide (TPR) repeat protein
MTSISYTYLGLAKAEQRHFNEAENYFSQSFEQMKKINDEKARLIVEYQNTGYYARIQMLADNPTKSVDLYNKALMLAEKANIQANLELSQLHQGLSEALSAQGNSLKAKAEMLKAIDLWDQARKYCEKGNSMRSFAASRKSLGESCS